MPKSKKIYYVLHSPASLIQHRYKYISLQKKVFRNLSFIAVSENVKQQSMPYIKPCKVHVIHHGIDLQLFTAKKDFTPNKKIRLLTVAALESWKGIQHIISIFKYSSISDRFTYDIIGKGPYEKSLKDLLTKYNIGKSISFLGSIDNVEAILPEYDIYCQLSDGEAFGISVIEAMASGLPTIVSNLPPFIEMFNNEVIKVNPYSKEEIIKSLESLLTMDKRKVLGSAGRYYVHSNFNVEKMGSDYINLLWGQG